MYRDYVIGPLFEFRYSRLDVSKRDWKECFEDLIYQTIESMRGHLSNPERTGDIDVAEFDDRIEMRFKPCGSGGRSSAGDLIGGSPSRHLAPFYFRTIEGKYDFVGRRRGVCLYCAHCTIMMEKLSIEKFGYPTRIVEPPNFQEGINECKYIMYKNLRDIPEEIYERNGEKKPGASEALGSEGRHYVAKASEDETANLKERF